MNKIEKHDFGYKLNSTRINKLWLENIDDLTMYVQNVCQTAFNAMFIESSNTLIFFDKVRKVKVEIEQLDE